MRADVLFANGRANRSIVPLPKMDFQLAIVAKHYAKGDPVPHVLLPDFLDPGVASTIAEEFPDPHTDAWTQYKHHNENKLGMAKREFFPRVLGEVTDELNSPSFVAWLSE